MKWVLLLLVSIPGFAQNDFRTIHKTMVQGGPQAINLYQNLVKSKSIPFVSNDSVLFIYSGKVNSVHWYGDFNKWGRDSKAPQTGLQSPGTELWFLPLKLAADARVDYKIVLNSSQWILDPVNPYQQWSGVGGGSPNSEVRMPAYQSSSISVERPGIPKGTLQTDLVFTSHTLGYQITYSIYIPAKPTSAKSVLYVTDGYEYLHPELGNMKTQLDNLIHDQRIEPLMVIFIDHREPVNRANNRRMQELMMNRTFKDFLISEFCSTIEKDHNLIPLNRGIMGTSLGGLMATYCAFDGYFTHIGIQSPAYAIKPEIFTLIPNEASPKPLKFVITSGTINDTQDESKKMVALLQNAQYKVTYHEVNQGHSWGNWRGLIDELLIHLFPSI